MFYKHLYTESGRLIILNDADNIQKTLLDQTLLKKGNLCHIRNTLVHFFENNQSALLGHTLVYQNHQ